MDVKERQDSHRRNLKQSISFRVWPLVCYFSTAFQNWWLQKGLSCMPSFQRNLFWNKITPHALARQGFLLSPLLACQVCAGGSVRPSQGLTSARSCQQMEQLLSQHGPVETAQVGSEMGICVWTVQGNFRKQWAKSTLVTKVVRKDGFILLLSLGKLEPLEVVPGRNEVSALKESCVGGKGDPLINFSPSVSQIVTAGRKSAALFSKTPHNPELGKQHFHKKHEVLQVVVAWSILGNTLCGICGKGCL